MILVTGGTGFIGQALIYHLVEDGKAVRTLLRPSSQTPELPVGVPVEVAISSIFDERSLRAAVVGVDTIYHLVGGEWQGVHVDLTQIEIEGIKTLIRVAGEAGVKQIIYLSHLGADRASAYPVFKVKGIVEEYIRRSELDYTIIQSGLVFGKDDNFTTPLAKLLTLFPFIFLVPGKGETLVHPIWVEDLVTCLSWAPDIEEAHNQTLRIGGPEFLSIQSIIEEVMGGIGIKRRVVGLQPSYMRIAGVFLEYFFPRLPLSVYWIDYLAVNRTCEIDSVPRLFGLLPVRFSQHLGHLQGINWRQLALRELGQRR
ncbi:MAG: NAD(P)H-binding protein [Anaerolineales bacterium]|jgi:NADH dehydrogenase